jgi:Arm DNA-binding domain
MSKLSAKFVENVAKKGRYHDGSGLMLCVNSSLTNLQKSWVVRYTSPISKARRDAGVGSYADIGLAQARLLAAKIRVKVASGLDPLDVAEKKSGRFSRANERMLAQSKGCRGSAY